MAIFKKRSVLLSSVLLLISLSCSQPAQHLGKVHIAGAMKNVMWKGELNPIIHLDTIPDKKGLYGLGPLAGLRGEILIKDGQSFQSKVLSDSTMLVEETYNVGAPFFVYARQQIWSKKPLPRDIETIAVLERYIEGQMADFKEPFVFKLRGSINSALIHIQNLPPGTQVSSPQEAHQGQINYPLGREEVEIIGFFSKAHQGIFTHHDTNVHLHLITQDEQKMGHLDEVELGRMDLYLPK